jgi:hypothetical protein
MMMVVVLVVRYLLRVGKTSFKGNESIFDLPLGNDSLLDIGVHIGSIGHEYSRESWVLGAIEDL